MSFTGMGVGVYVPIMEIFSEPNLLEEDLYHLGINAKLSNDYNTIEDHESWPIYTLEFSSKEDMNLYKISGKYKPGSALIFKCNHI